MSDCHSKDDKDPEQTSLSYIWTPESRPSYLPPCQYFHLQGDECNHQVPLLHILPPEYSTLANAEADKVVKQAPIVLVDCTHTVSVRKPSGCHKVKVICSKKPRLLNMILAMFSCAFANPLFGAIAFILIMLAERSSSEKSARHLDKASLVVAVTGCVTGPVFIAVTLIVLTRTTNPTPPPCIECDIPDWKPFQQAVTAPSTTEFDVTSRWNRGRWGYKTTDRSPSGGSCEGYLVHGVCYSGRYKAHCYHGSNCCHRPTHFHYAGFCHFVRGRGNSGWHRN